MDLNRLKPYLIGVISRALEANPPTAMERRQVIIKYLQQAYRSTKINLPLPQQEQLFREVLDDLLGYGKVQPLLDDPSISEIMVNGPQQVYVERNGKLSKTDITFQNDQEIYQLIDKIVAPLGRRIDNENPTVDARLPDGSRVNAIVPPVAIDGPGITIRKFNREKLTVEQLISLGSLSESMVELLNACVKSHLNIVISGGTGSGKTTLLNILSGFIPPEERIVTIEDAAELQLQQEHVFRLETKPPDPSGKNGVSIRHLVRNSLRMRPDRIVVGEVRGGEALDMLQAMNTGHDGSLTTLHANTPRDAISRLETMCLMSGLELPLKVIRQQIASAVDLVIQQSRLRDGSRKIVTITEVAGMEGDTVVMTDLFQFEQTGLTTEGAIMGEYRSTGIRPIFIPRLEAYGFKLSRSVFGVNLGDMLGPRKR